MEKTIQKMARIVKDRRCELGISLTNVAKKSGLTYMTVWAVENGRACSVHSLLSILEVLQLDINFTNKESKDENSDS